MEQFARDLVVESLPDGGLLVIDPEALRSHTLNTSAAVVWRAWEEGVRDVGALGERIAAATGLPADAGIAHSALAQLADARLVREEIAAPDLATVSRRRLLSLAAGTGFRLPLVETILTPSPADAESGAPPTPPGAPPGG